MRKLILAGALAACGTAAIGADAAKMEFTPSPRWDEDPETEVVCAAVRSECPAMAANGQIETEFGYDVLYDASGMLKGVRMTQSTGCKPLDEHMVLSEAHFVGAFHSDDKPDLDDTHAEVPPGVDKAGVRIVKAKTTQLSLGCAPG